jgi:hypothetical protein
VGWSPCLGPNLKLFCPQLIAHQPLLCPRARRKPQKGTLRQDASWMLQLESGASDQFELRDNEKNWAPFVHNNALYLSYSIQPHVVLRCAWSGGWCRLVHNTTSDFLATYETLQQGLRGGTPYAQLPDGTRLAALHVKDAAHMPSLYSTAFYIVDGTPPFRVLSLSPKICLSEQSVELAISARCALQYVVGLTIEAESNLILISYGQMDRQMHLAALPLDHVLSLARTHVLSDSCSVPSMSDCIRLDVDDN